VHDFNQINASAAQIVVFHAGISQLRFGCINVFSHQFILTHLQIAEDAFSQTYKFASYMILPGVSAALLIDERRQRRGSSV
jgi:hypothetical protein